jgi:hypothetical protein
MITVKESIILCGILGNRKLIELWNLLKTPSRFYSLTVASLLCLSLPLAVQGQSDDFNDAEDTVPIEWIHYDAIATLTGGAAQNTWSFTNGGYRFEAVPSPSTTLGPARVSSFPTNIFTNFYVSVDITDWNTNYSQAFGILARAGDFSTMNSPTTRGYGFAYINGAASASGDNFIAIFRLRNDASTTGVPGSGTNVAEVHGINLDPTKDYRLVFIGEGNHMEGRVYELPNIDTPFAIVSANSTGQATIHTDGQSGLLAFNVADASGLPFSGPVDVTFDNYLATSEPQLVCGKNPPIIADNFNDGDDAGWTRYPDPVTLSQTWSFPTNPASAGNIAYRLTSMSGTSAANYGRNLSIRSGDTSMTDFCIESDLIDWDNAQSQQMGVVARFQPGTETNAVPSCYMLIYANRFSAGAGGTDQLRIYEVSPTVGLGFLHQGQGGLGQFGVVPFGDPPPAPTGNYRLRFKGIGNVLTGQIIDLDTGLPMTFNDGTGHLTNMVATSWATNFVSGKVGLGVFQNNLGSPDTTLDNFIAGPWGPSATIVADAGTVKVSWPAQQEDIWVLESSSSIDAGATWTEITAEKISYANGLNTYTVSSPTGDSFFRLRRI